eukprot:694202-Pyramimonas_sp.AAC.1
MPGRAGRAGRVGRFQVRVHAVCHAYVATGAVLAVSVGRHRRKLRAERSLRRKGGGICNCERVD